MQNIENIIGFVKKLYREDKLLVRNYATLFLIFILCTSALIFVFISGDYKISKIDSQVVNTYNIINDAQGLSALLEGVVAAQRGFIITQDDKFLEKYNKRRNRISELIASLSELTSNNPSQLSRLYELRHHFSEFSVKLEKRAQTFTISNSSKVILNDLEEIDGLKDNILQINSAILRAEYGLLNERINAIETQKSIYFMTLLIGILTTFAMLLIFNSFVFNIQKKRNKIEESLRDTEKRYALAVEGTQDGIFDWNIKTGETFYSKQFFGMLGFERKAYTGTILDFKECLHPEDAARVWGHLERYLNREISEHSQEFRLKSKNGGWVWVQCRAKAIFDDDGNALRLVGAHTNITYLKENQARLESEKKAAEEANRAKSDFLAHMSHEIRTPLTAISGIAEIFQIKQDNLDDKQKKLVRTLHSSTSALKDLINDVLDFSKIESGELELDESQFEIITLFEEVISMMAMRAHEKGISFVFDYSGVKDMYFYGDKTRLRQILVNLIGNAIKFTEEGGVTVKAYRHKRGEKEFFNIDVVDTGIGIAAENFDLVFERFKQTDASVSRKYGGTGLGLPISRNLAKLMNGNIILSSELGKGSTFSVYLPLKENDVFKAETEHKNNDNKETSSNKGKHSTHDIKRKILMVEDYEGNIVVIGHILEDLGCSYDVARTGVEALALWQRNNYALVLMDIQMPEMDGFSATRSIREQEKKKGIPYTPIIGMTAHALVGDKDKCIAAGMDAYLPKPIIEIELKQKILKYLNKKQEAA
jgi:PAS domain S-box-containing protein